MIVLTCVSLAISILSLAVSMFHLIKANEILEGVDSILGFIESEIAHTNQEKDKIGVDLEKRLKGLQMARFSTDMSPMSKVRSNGRKI